MTLAKYCFKRLPCSSSVLSVEIGKVTFERCKTEHLSGISVPDKEYMSARQGSLIGSFVNISGIHWY